MKEQKQEHKKEKSRSFVKFILWFTLLSTLGVGGGIFFLLFAVVPIEQAYVEREWSQFKIDSIMRYYVFGWVAFGFLVSFIYYFFIVRKGYWKTAIGLAFSSILLCIGALYYFLNTDSGIVQQSQGAIQEGERFTFGPYPEREDLERLKEEGYDGVISLINPLLPIEKPLLDKEKSNTNHVDIELHSLPMMPWVGDNSNSIEKLKELIHTDGKKYYVHCYLGKHRVDVVKQVINEELGDTYDLMFLQPTTLERGSLYYFPDQEILMGPFPTDEEWFTRISRGEVQEIVSLLDYSNEKWLTKEQQITEEMGLKFTHMPMNDSPSLQDIKNLAEYVEATEDKVYVHNFKSPKQIEMLETYLSWGKTIVHDKNFKLNSGEFRKVGEKLIIGYSPTTYDRQKLIASGIEQFIEADISSEQAMYQQIKALKEDQKLTYITVPNVASLQSYTHIATGLFYGADDLVKSLAQGQLAGGPMIRHERNLILGPLLTEQEYDSFAIHNGIAQIIFLYPSSTLATSEVQKIEAAAAAKQIQLIKIPMTENYEEQLLPLIEQESGLTYIMTDPMLLQLVHDFIKKF